MTERLPTRVQVDILRAIADGLVGAVGDRYVRFADQTSGSVTAPVKRLIANGWAEQRDAAAVVLTPEGAHALDDASALYDWEDVPYADRPRVSVTRRRRGMHPIRGMGKVPDGRNVRCFDCPDTEVWYTNESDRGVQRRAEIAAAKHGMRHVRGELPTAPRAGVQARA